MKIIENALNPNWTKEVKCTNCSSKLEISVPDLIRRSGRGQDEDFAEYTCPVCKRTNYVYPNSIPKSAWLTIK